jgi:hypothetical protein
MFGLPCLIELGETKMRRRLGQVLCSTLLLLIAGNGRLAAIENEPAPADSAALGPGTNVSCSRPATPVEPADPSVTAAISHKFIASQRFRENTSPAAEVRISWLGATFMRRFAVEIEDDTNDVALQIHALNRASSDNQIMAELHDRYETRLADVWCFLKLQANGEDGALQTNAVPNVFFVRDATGELGAVDTVWSGAGWEIGASPVGGQRQWPSGSRVISR